MSSEGELKKLIRSTIDGKYYNVSTAFVRIGHVDNAIDEAAKEFPWYVLCNIGTPMFDPDRESLEKWFRKWFGGPEGAKP